MASAQKKVKVAVFDIDGTIFRSSLLIEIVNALVAQGIFPPLAKSEVERDHLAWLNRQGHYDSYIGQVVKVYQCYIAGCKEAEVMKTIDEVIDYHKDRVYRYTRELIKKLKKENYFLIAISGSPDFVVNRYTRYLGFDASFGVVDQVIGGRFTGKQLDDRTVQEKHVILQEWADKEHLVIDWKNSYAIGDSGGDISLLELVGKPIAFNPAMKLAKHAQAKGWKIILERKDVAYELGDFSITEFADR